MVQPGHHTSPVPEWSHGKMINLDLVGWLWDGGGGFEPVAFRTMDVSLGNDWRLYNPLSVSLILLRFALERV